MSPPAVVVLRNNRFGCSCQKTKAQAPSTTRAFTTAAGDGRRSCKSGGRQRDGAGAGAVSGASAVSGAVVVGAVMRPPCCPLRELWRRHTLRARQLEDAAQADAFA